MWHKGPTIFMFIQRQIRWIKERGRKNVYIRSFGVRLPALRLGNLLGLLICRSITKTFFVIVDWMEAGIDKSIRYFSATSHGRKWIVLSAAYARRLSHSFFVVLFENFCRVTNITLTTKRRARRENILFKRKDERILFDISEIGSSTRNYTD